MLIRFFKLSDSRILNLNKLCSTSSGGIFVIDHKIPSHFESNSWASSLRRVIVKKNSVIKNGIMSASNTEVVVSHVSDLFSAKDQIVFLGFLLLQTDFLREVRILDDLVQSRRNLRVQHFKNREILNLIHWIEIHDIPSEGKSEQELTCVLNHIFQHDNDESVGEFLELTLRHLQSSLYSHGILWNCRWWERIHGWRPSSSLHWDSTCAALIWWLKHSLMMHLWWISNINVDCQNCFPESQTNSMCQLACFGRGST